MLRFVSLYLAATILAAETYTFTLKQAVDRSLRQNPDIALARLDEQKALQGIRVARDPFSPHVGIGSGLAYSSGFPLSIEGAAPSVVRAQASQSLFNRAQTFAVAQARENARGAGFVSASKRDEVAYRTASLFLDGDRATRLQVLAAKQVESLRSVIKTVQGRVQEGRELPIETRRANVDLQKALQRQETLPPIRISPNDPWPLFLATLRKTVPAPPPMTAPPSKFRPPKKPRWSRHWPQAKN